MMPRPVLLLTMIVLIAAVLGGCGTITSMQETWTIQTKLDDAGFKNVAVSRSAQMVNGATTHTITTIVDRPQNPPFDQKLATQIAEIVITNYSRVQDLDYVTVQLRGSGNPTTLTLSPNVWMELVRDFSEPPGIKSAVLAMGVREDDVVGFEPVDPTTDFPTEQAIYHAIIAVKNLPPNTPVKSVWTAVDTHGAAPPNQKISESDVKWSGSGRIVSTLASKSKNGVKLPKGSYKLDVSWDDKVQATLPFTIAGG
jgi:hypothetical protein